MQFSRFKRSASTEKYPIIIFLHTRHEMSKGTTKKINHNTISSYKLEKRHMAHYMDMLPRDIKFS